MRKMSFTVFLALMFVGVINAQTKENSTSKNMQDIQWGTETHVIHCSDFGVTPPLRELMQESSTLKRKEKKMKEFPDKRDMPVQSFPYKVKEHGEAYGNYQAMIQTIGGQNIGHEQNKALEQNWAGQSPSVGFRPFDPSGAAGPNHYIQLINGDTYEIWNKTGTSLGAGTISALWSPAGGDGDPIALYDKEADRFFISQFGGSGDNGIWIAVSQTPDPTGAWYTYKFTSPDFPDYLKFSAWQDGYYMTANYSQKIFAFNRTKMLAGDGTAESVYQTFSPPQSGFFVPLPADASDGVMPGAGTPCPIFSYSDNGWGGGNVDAVNIYNASVNWSTTNMTVSTAANLSTNAFDASYDGSWNDISQPGTSQKLDGIGGCLMFRAQWKTWSGYNTVVLNWAVKISATQRGIFWCELRQDQSTSNWSIYQQGIYAPGSDSYWMGSIAMNDNGDIGLAYAKGSSSTYMSLGYTGRLASDPLGTMPIAEVMAMDGTGSQTGMNRVGDYAQTCLDPDGQTFWHTGEYLGAGGSAKTRIYSFKFVAPCTAPTNQATNYNTTAVGDNQMTVNWTRGNGNRVIVLAHEAAVVDVNPGNGVSYTANAAFGSGDQIGVGNYVVYDGTGTNVTVTGLSAGTTYHYSVFEYSTTDDCYLTPALTGSTTTTGSAPCTPCNDVTSTTDDGSGVTVFSFNTISNTSSGDPAYTDYTAQSTSVTQGQSYNLAAEVNTAGNYTVNTKAWIDWNQNCDFTDAGEEYDLGSAVNVTSGAPSLSPVSITVPAGALTGNTILRIRTTYNTAPVPCGNQNYSEAEDYTINVTASGGSAPVAAFSGTPLTLCAGSDVTFTDASTNTPTSWTWNFGDGSPTVSTQNPTHTYATAGTYTVTLTAGNASGSDDEIKTNYITVNAATAITGNPISATECEGSNVTFTVAATGSNLSYQWKKGAANVGPNNASYTITGITAADAASYTCVVSGTCGSATSNAATLTVNPATAITGQPAGGTLCEGADITFTVTASGSNLSYQWKKGTNNVGPNSASFTISGITLADADDYTCVVTGDCGSVTSSVATLVVNPLPVAATSVDASATTICNGDQVTLTYVGGSGTTFSWYPATSNTSVIGSGNNFTYSPTTTTTFYGRWEGSCGSSSFMSVTVTVVDLPVAATSASASETTICVGDPSTLSYTGGSGDTFNWYSTSCGTDLVGSGNSLSVSPTTTTTYYGRWENTCGNSTCETVTITVNDLPTAGFSIDASGEPVINFTNTSTNADSYSWDLGDGTIETTTDVTHEYASNGTFTVILSATNACGTVSTNPQALSITNIGIASLGKESIKIFPNPTETILNLRLPIENVDIKLVSMDGKTLRSMQSKDAKHIEINVEHLSQGFYNLVLTTENDEQVVIKVVKK